MLSFTEKPTLVYAILGLVAFVLLVGLWRTRKREYTIGLGVVAALALLVWMLDFFIITDGEQIERTIDDMAAAVKKRDTDGIFKHIARDFTFRGFDRKTFRDLVNRYLPTGEVTEVLVWPPDKMKVTRSGDKGTATVNFQVKPKGPANPGEIPAGIEATFVLEDGKWKLQKFEAFKPGMTETLDVPGLAHP